MDKKTITSLEELKEAARDNDGVIKLRGILVCADLTIDLPIALPFALKGRDDVLQDVIIQNCDFKKKIWLRLNNTISYCRFDNCTFDSIDTNNKTFNGKMRFRNCTFNKKFQFNNTVFKDLVEFWNSTFIDKVIFYKVDFEKTIVFSESTFKDNALFTYSKISERAIFRGTVFKKGLDLSLAIIGGDLGLFDLKLKDFQSVDTFIPENEYEHIVSTIGDIPAKNKRETFRILKKYHIDQKNPVEYEDYSLLESVSHRKEVWHRLKSQQRSWKYFWDYSLLTLNRISNKHKTNYWRGFLFTAAIGWVFFYFALISTELISIEIDPSNWSLDTFSLSAKHYFISLAPTHKYAYMDDLKPNSWFYLWDLLGRLFIAYGIYQTIQAFRKFR